MSETILAALLGALLGAGLTALLGYLTAYQLLQREINANYEMLEKQIKENRKTAQIQIFLEFDKRLTEFNKVHIALRGAEPDKTISDEDWPDIDGYMGAFERLYLLLRDGVINRRDAKSLYGYRLENIVNNKEIRQAKLRNEEESWYYFSEVCKTLEIDIPID